MNLPGIGDGRAGSAPTGRGAGVAGCLARVRWRALAIPLFLGMALHGAVRPDLTWSKETVYAGEPVTLIATSPGSDPEQPVIQNPEGTIARFVDKQTRTNGDNKTYTAFRYLVVARAPGSYLITLDAGLNVDLEPVLATITLEAKQPELTDDMKLTTRLSQTSCYVGEPVVLDVEWLLSVPVQNVRAVDMRIPLMENQDVRVITPAAELQGGPQTIGVPASESRVIANRDVVRIEKTPWTRIRFRRIIVPRVAGSLKLPPATLLCSVYRGAASRFQYPSYFNNDFFLNDEEDDKHVRTFVRGEPLTLEIKPLPPGAPANFSGIVGTPAIQLEAAVDEVEAGEPVALTIAVSEVAIPEAFELPLLKTLSAYATRFDCPNAVVAGHVEENVVRFERIIRPQRPDVREIPAIALTVLNPKTDRYETVRSNALPLKVNPARRFTAFDADFSDGRNLKNPLTPAAEGIGHNVIGAAALVRAQPVVGGLPDWLLWLALLAPPAVFFVAWLRQTTWYQTVTDPRRRAARAAYCELRNCPATDPLRLAVCMRTYLALRLDLLPHAHAVADVAAAADLPLHELTPLASLYQAEAAARYADTDKQPDTIDRDGLLALAARIQRRPPSTTRAHLATLLLLCLALPLAARADEAIVHLKEAEHVFDQALATAMDDSVEAKRRYREAALRYEAVIADFDVHNAAIHLNTGNAWYLADDRGQAIYHYLCGLRYDPANRQLSRSLQAVRAEVSDVVPVSPWQQAQTAVQRAAAFFPEWLRLLLFFIAYAACWRLLWRLVRRQSVNRNAAAAIVLVTILLLAGLLANRRQAQLGVVTEAEIMPRKGNAFTYPGAFDSPMHAGTEFIVREVRNDWIHLQLPNKETAWLPTHAVRLVQNQ